MPPESLAAAIGDAATVALCGPAGVGGVKLLAGGGGGAGGIAIVRSFGAKPVDAGLEGRQVAVAVVVGVDDGRPEAVHGLRRLLHRHGIGQVHRQEGEGDVGQRQHLRHRLGVARHIDALVPEGDHIAVAHALGVVLKPLRRDVVGRHRLDGVAEQVRGLAIGDGGRLRLQRLRQLVEHFL